MSEDREGQRVIEEILDAVDEWLDRPAWTTLLDEFSMRPPTGADVDEVLDAITSGSAFWMGGESLGAGFAREASASHVESRIERVLGRPAAKGADVTQQVLVPLIGLFQRGGLGPEQQGGALIE